MALTDGTPTDGGLPTEEFPYLDEITLPEIAYRPRGQEDGLVEYYLYRIVREAESGATLINFIDAVGQKVTEVDVNSEVQEERIDRLAAIVADMPLEIGDEQVLSVWDHFLSSDWVHHHSRAFVVESAITQLQAKSPFTGARVREQVAMVAALKADMFAQEVGFSETYPNPTSGEHDAAVLMHAGFTLSTRHPEQEQPYNSVIVLSRAYRNSATR